MRFHAAYVAAVFACHFSFQPVFAYASPQKKNAGGSGVFYLLFHSPFCFFHVSKPLHFKMYLYSSYSRLTCVGSILCHAIFLIKLAALIRHLISMSGKVEIWSNFFEP